MKKNSTESQRFWRRRNFTAYSLKGMESRLRAIWQENPTVLTTEEALLFQELCGTLRVINENWTKQSESLK